MAASGSKPAAEPANADPPASAASPPGGKRKGHSTLLEVILFGAVGAGATGIYALLTWLGIELFRFPPVLSSTGAYLVAAVWSFLGHRMLTFVSSASPAVEGPRFIVVTVSGMLVAASVIWVTATLHWPTIVGVVIVSGGIPIVNYFVLKWWVFRG